MTLAKKVVVAAARHADIRYDQSIGGVALAASFGPDPHSDGDIEYALGMSFATNGITVGAGFDSDDGMVLGVGYALNDDLSLNGYYTEEEDADGMGGDLNIWPWRNDIDCCFCHQQQGPQGCWIWDLLMISAAAPAWSQDLGR